MNLAVMLLGYGLAGCLAFFTPLPGDAVVVEAALSLCGKESFFGGISRFFAFTERKKA